MADDLSPGDRYVIVRRAVRDAIWDVLGDLFALLIVVVLLSLGVPLALGSLGGGVGGFALPGVAVGLVLIALAGYLVWTTFYR